MVVSPPCQSSHSTLIWKLFSDNEVLGNVILKARKVWYQGFEERWNEMPELPSSYLITPLIEEAAAQLDVETATNLTRNFLD